MAGAGALGVLDLGLGLLGMGLQENHASKADKLSREQFEYAKQQDALQQANWQTVFDNTNYWNRQQFDYQERLNAAQMMREDSAYQRKVADLKRAGLNPVLAASGSGASSSPLSAGSTHSASVGQVGSQGTSALGNRAAVQLQISAARLAYLQNLRAAVQQQADISKTNAERKLIESQKDHQDIINKYEDKVQSGKILSQELDNQLKSGTLQSNIEIVSSKLRISKKEELVKNLDLILGQDKHVLNKIDIEISKLIKEGKIKENDILDKKLELLTTECLQKALDYSNSQYNTVWYHAYGVPSGFNSSWIGQLSQFISSMLIKGSIGRGPASDLSDYIYSVTGRRPIVNDVRRPNVSGFYNRYRAKQINTSDYGVKRNVF